VLFRSRFFKDGDVIMREGEMAKAMFFVIKGVCTVGADDFETIYAELSAPSFFGEMAAIMQIHRTITVRASTRCILAVLNSSDLERTFLQYPEVTQSIREHVSALLTEMSKNLNRMDGTTGTKFSAENLEKYAEMKKDTSHGSLNDFRQSSFNNLSSRRTSQMVLDVSGLDDNQDNRISNSLLASSIAEWDAPKDDDDDLEEEEVGGISPLATFSPAGKTLSSPSSFMNATLMKHGGMMGPRRASVAVWADQKLMQMVQNNSAPNTKESATPKKGLSRLGTTSSSFTDDTLSLSPILSDKFAKGYGILGKFIMQRLLKLLDFTNLYKFRLVSRQISMMITAEPEKYPCLVDIDLSLYHKKINDNVISTMAEFCGYAIQTLSLKGCWSITDKGVQVISNRLPKLRVLSLASVWDSTDVGLSSLSMRVSASPMTSSDSLLTHLDLSNCRKITDVGILSVLDSCESLQSLELSYCKNLTAKMLDHPMWPRIHKLNLQRCTAIGDAGFKQWHTQVTSKLSSTDGETDSASPLKFQMSELNLSDCSFLTDAAILNISVTCSNLQIIALSFCCGLSAAAISSLAENCQELKSLDVSFCGSAATDESIEVISTKLNQLERLSVRGCVQVTDAGIAHLLKIRSLKVLNISQCRGVSKLATVNECLLVRDKAGWGT